MTVTIIKGTEVKIWLNDDIVGRASSVSCRIENNVTPYHEVGDRDAVEMLEGNLAITGTLERAVINGLLVGKVLGSESESSGVYTLNAEQYVYPEATVSGESIAADDTQTVFEFSNKPPINGTVVIKRDAVAWGTEGVDYVVDYENGYIGFTTPPASANTWTKDYHYGRSWTLTFVMQVGDGTHQRLDITIGQVKFDTNEITINNTGDAVTESLDYKAGVITGLGLGAASGV